MIDLNMRKKVKKALPNREDSREVRDLKIAILLFVSLFSLMIIAGIVAFFIALRGPEETLVPKLMGKDLIPALLELQEKDLYPEIQVRYSAEYSRGTVISQNPLPGSVVKAGRRVEIIVSKGPIVDRVENFVGQNINDVRIHLQTLFASHKALLKIKDSALMYKYDESAPGTILAQKPEPGTPITGVTYLQFVVSKGPKGEVVEVGDYIGKSFKEVISELASANIPFVFTVRDPKEGEKGGVVVSQSPDPKSEISYGSVVQLEMTRPLRVKKGMIFGVFKHILPDYPIMVNIKLEAVMPDGSKETLLSMKHPGGPISVPYIVPENTELILYLFDKEEIRQKAVSEM